MLSFEEKTARKQAKKIKEKYNLNTTIKDIATVILAQKHNDYTKVFDTVLYDKKSGLYCLLLEILHKESEALKC